MSLKLFLVCVTIIHYGLSAKMEIDFLNDFLREKTTMITMHTCWNSIDIKGFIKKTSNRRQISYFCNSNDRRHFLSYLANNNYFIIDLNDCETSWQILDKAESLGLFRAPLKYLLLIHETHMVELTNKLQNYSILPSSDVIVAETRENCVHLGQPYKTNSSNAIIWEDFGNWSYEFGLRENFKRFPMTSRRHNLKRVHMNVGFMVTNNDTWNHFDDFRYPRVDSFAKQDYGTYRSLLDYANVNATYIGSKYFGYYNNETKTWNGLVDDLWHNRIHIAAAAIYFTQERFNAIDFLRVQNPSAIKFILKRPPLSYTTNIFYLAFRNNVWICTIIMSILVGITLYAVLNWEIKSKKQLDESNMQIKRANKLGVSDVTLILLEVLCQQGTTTEAKCTSGRIVQLTSFISFMFLYLSYSAYIVVLLQSTTRIESTKQLLESRLEAGGLNTNYMLFYFSNAKDRYRKALYEKKIGPDGLYSLSVGMTKVRNGFFAFHTEIAAAYDYILETFTDYEMCGLQELEGYTESLQGYSALPKNSPYKEIFKVGITRVDEHGLRKRHHLRYIIKPKCYSIGGNFDSVGMIDCYIVILIIVIGVPLSVVIMLMEMVVYNMTIKRRNGGII